MTRPVLLLATLFSLSVSASPHLARQDQGPASATPPPANCEISGVVTEAATGRPLAGAQVMVFSQSPLMYSAGGPFSSVLPVGSPCDHCDVLGNLRYEALTDARGRFTIRKVVPGQYMVRALASGYAGQYFQVKERYAFPNGFFLRSGQKRDDVRIRLPRQAVLTGRVLDEHGQPVISAYVQVMQYGPPAAKQKRLLPVTATVTDDRGEYRLFGLSPGRYYIQARYQPGFDLSRFRPIDVAYRFLVPRVSLKTFSPAFYYPGVTAPNKAKPINVGPSQVLSRLDISVRPLTPAESAKLYPERFRTPPAGDCRVAGAVTDTATGRPMDHAWVFLGPANGAMQPPNSMTSTNAEGRFDFRGISCTSGPQPLLAWKDGFVEVFHRATENVYPPGTKYPFPPQPKVKHVNLSLVPAGVITGRITDVHGEPAACVRVALIPRSYARSRRWLYPSRETVTDDRGQYRFYQLKAGQYYVAAQFQPSNAVATQTTAKFPAIETSASGAMFTSPYVYYPDAANVGNATEIRVTPGEEVKGIDFSVKPETTYTISGVVEGPALQAVERGLRVVLAPARGPYGLPFPVHQPPLNVSGNFQISGVTPGSYILWATAFLRDGQYAAWAPVTVEHANVTGVTLDPHPGWTITGHLNVEGQPHGKLVYQISAQQQDDPLVAETATARDVPAGSSFELKGLFTGHYLLRVEAVPSRMERWVPGRTIPSVRRPPNMYIKSAMFGAQTVRTSLLEVPMQGPTGTLDLNVDWNGAQIEGAAMNSRGEPAGSAEIVLIPENRKKLPWWRIRSARPYFHGRFLIPAVPPGKYRLFAWEDLPEGVWFDPDFVNSQWKKGLILDLSEGETKSVKLRVLDAPIPRMRRNR